MLKFAFVSRHVPTQEQIVIAAAKNIELLHVGDVDAFEGDWLSVVRENHCKGIIVVHPALALRACMDMPFVGVFENAVRPSQGEKPTFVAKELHVYRLFWEVDAPHEFREVSSEELRSLQHKDI